MLGGENQRSSLIISSGYSNKAQFIGKPPSYLEPNSGSLQKPIEGVYAENIEDRARIGVLRCQCHVEKSARVYLERIRNGMQKPIEGLSQAIAQAAPLHGKRKITVPVNPQSRCPTLPSTEEILTKLKAKARPDQLPGMARYGMKTENRLGVQIPELRKLAKETGKNHQLALELWKTDIAEARILAGMVDEPEKVTEQQMDNWVKDIDSWDIGDQTCMNLFEKTPLAWKKITEWSNRPEEFVKRTAFGLLACLAWHSKTATDQQFTALFSVIASGAMDERKSIQKAVSWALRNILSLIHI